MALVPLCGLLLASAVALSAGCTEDPRYVYPPGPISAVPVIDEDAPPIPPIQLVLPIRLEEEKEAEDRAALAAELGVEVPFISIDDIDLSLEWTIENLDDSEAQVRILLTGANEYFAYVPASFVVDPEEEPTPPPLAGDIPLIVPALGSISGVFREDQIREASLDLDLITRGALNPFAAMLESHDGMDEIVVEGQAAIPVSAFASLIRFDLALTTNRRVTMRYALRARSHIRPNLVHDEGLAAVAGELTVFEPVDFVPPPPVEEAP
jgi:hypothetical protein